MSLVGLLFAISLASIALAEDKGGCPVLNSMSKFPKEKRWSFPQLDRSNPALVKMATCKSHENGTDVDLDITLTDACTGIETHLSDKCTSVTKDAINYEEPPRLPAKDQAPDFCEFNWYGGRYRPWLSVDLMKQIADPTRATWDEGYVNIAPGTWQILENWSLRVSVNSRSGVDQIHIRGIDAVQLYNAYVFPPFWVVAENPRSSKTTGVFIKNGMVGATKGHGFVLGPGSAVVVDGNKEHTCYDNSHCARNSTSFIVANGTVWVGANSKLMVSGPHASLVLQSTSNDSSNIAIPSNVTVCVCHGKEDPAKYRGYGSIVLNSDAINDLTPGWNYLFNMPNLQAYAEHVNQFTIRRGRFKPKAGDKDPFADPDVRIDFAPPWGHVPQKFTKFIRYTGENPPSGFDNCCLELMRGGKKKPFQGGFRDVMDAAWSNSKSKFSERSCPAYKSDPLPIPPDTAQTDPGFPTTGPKTVPITEEPKTGTKFRTTALPTTSATTQETTLPGWVIPVSVVFGLVLVGACVAALVFWKKRSTSETETTEALSLEHNQEMKDQSFNPALTMSDGPELGSKKEPVIRKDRPKLGSKKEPVIREDGPASVSVSGSDRVSKE